MLTDNRCAQKQPIHGLGTVWALLAMGPILALLPAHPAQAAEVPFSTTNTVEGDFDYAYCVRAADINGDGHMDILACGYEADTVAWWENDGTGSLWTIHTIDDAFQGPTCVEAADIDGDGDLTF